MKGIGLGNALEILRPKLRLVIPGEEVFDYAKNSRGSWSAITASLDHGRNPRDLSAESEEFRNLQYI